MKKLACSAVVLVMVAVSAPALGFMMFGGGVGYSTQDLSATEKLDLVNVAFQMSYLYGEPVGMFLDMSAGTAVSAQYNGSALDLSIYDVNLGVDAIFGLGFRIPSSRLWTAAVGGGLYFGEQMLMPTSYTMNSYTSFSLGVGVGGYFAYWLTANLYLGANAAVAYGLFSPLAAMSDYSSNGLRAFGGVGIGLAF